MHFYAFTKQNMFKISFFFSYYSLSFSPHTHTLLLPFYLRFFLLYIFFRKCLVLFYLFFLDFFLTFTLSLPLSHSLFLSRYLSLYLSLYFFLSISLAVTHTQLFSHDFILFFSLHPSLNVPNNIFCLNLFHFIFFGFTVQS